MLTFLEKNITKELIAIQNVTNKMLKGWKERKKETYL